MVAIFQQTLKAVQRQIMGREAVAAITKGKLDLGPWDKSSTAISMVWYPFTICVNSGRTPPVHLNACGLGSFIFAVA